MFQKTELLLELKIKILFMAVWLLNILLSKVLQSGRFQCQLFLTTLSNFQVLTWKSDLIPEIHSTWFQNPLLHNLCTRSAQVMFIMTQRDISKLSFALKMNLRKLMIWYSLLEVKQLFILNLLGFKETSANALLNSWLTHNRMILGSLVLNSSETSMLSSTQVLISPFKFGLLLMVFYQRIIPTLFISKTQQRCWTTPKIKFWTKREKVVMELSMMPHSNVLPPITSNHLPLTILSLSELNTTTIHFKQIKKSNHP